MSELTHRRDELLQEMAGIDRMQRGCLSEQFFKVNKDGREIIRGPYYVLQRWRAGKNVCERVPAKDVDSVQSSIEGYKRFEKLAEEFVDITERLTRQTGQDQDAKKNATKSAKRGSRRPKPS
jgi:hypothetical protein